MKSRILLIFTTLFLAVILLIYIRSFTYEDEGIQIEQLHADDAPDFYIAQYKYSTHTPLPVPSPIKGYRPDTIFYDKFNDELNLQCWNAVNRTEIYNQELQQYTNENVFTRDGCLVLMADKQDNTYFSGLVTTQNKVEFKYGIVEVSLKYPEGKSFFPAIWMLPADHARFPEIDIMEALGNNPNTLYFVHHYFYKGKQSSYTTCNIKNYNTFHTYKLVWQPESLCWYVDNRLVYTITEHIPKKKMYLIINLAVGGVWPGSPNEYTVFPSEVLVDYVKIIPYQSHKKEFMNDIN